MVRSEDDGVHTVIEVKETVRSHEVFFVVQSQCIASVELKSVYSYCGCVRNGQLTLCG